MVRSREPMCVRGGLVNTTHNSHNSSSLPLDGSVLGEAADQVTIPE
jgi:hypothetical protein